MYMMVYLTTPAASVLFHQIKLKFVVTLSNAQFLYQLD